MGRKKKNNLTDKVCPRCGGFLSIKYNATSDKKFYGCSNYHKNGCTYTEQFEEESKVVEPEDQTILDMIGKERHDTYMLEPMLAEFTSLQAKMLDVSPTEYLNELVRDKMRMAVPSKYMK